MSLRGFETKINVARVAMFDQPRRIIFATGATEQFLGAEAIRLGGKKVVVVTDKGVKKAGMADTATELLKKEHLDVTAYDEIAAEPTAQSVRAAIKFGREGQVNGLSQREAAFAFIHAVKTLMEDMELPTNLKQWDIPSKELDEFAEYIVKDRQHVYGLPRFNPRKLTVENTKELMHQLYEGNLPQ